ncbi:MAG: HYR domain-containing protein [Pseudomonadota bacterium]|nr:HYR domain-containing protein [Pseudomonadota bacterium]
MKLLSAAKGRWITAAALLILSVVAAPAMAQSCNGFASSLAVDPVAQNAQEFDAGSNYGPVTVTLTIKNATSLPSGASLVWTQTGGPAVTLNTSNPLRPTFVAPSVGAAGATLNFSVQARCNNVVTGNPAPASVTIQNVDRPPVVTALASPAIADAGQVVTLDATGSDPDGDSIAYTWTQIGTPAVTLSQPGAASTTFVAPTVPVAVTLQFRVEARAGTLARTASVTVTVTAANLPPFAALSCPPQVDEGKLFRLDGTGSYDPEGGPLTYEWFVNEIDAGLAFSLDGESGNYVDRVAPSLGLGMAGGVEVRLRVSESPTVFTDATCAFQIQDVTRPGLVLPADLLLDADSAAGTQVQSYVVSASDNVDGNLSAMVACNPSAPHLFPLGVNPVACAVEDSAGNDTKDRFNINVRDLSPPVFVLPGDVAIEGNTRGGGYLTYALPEATDKVDASVAVSCAPSSASFFPVGSTTVTCSATDAAGNGASVDFTATVHDTTPPALTLPGNISGVEATSPSGATVGFLATATDIVDGNVAVSCTPAAGSTFVLGTTMVNCSANDSAIRPNFPSGNVATGSFSVTVVDTTGPVIAARTDILRVEATGPLGAPVSYASPATSDAVDGAGTASCAPASGSTFALGLNTVTCSASDAAGNVATSTAFTIGVVDTTPPVIAPRSDILGVQATGPSGATVSYARPATSDIVDGPGTATCAPLSGTTFGLGETTVTCNATDAAGNPAVPTSFKVTVVDTTPPVIGPRSDILGVQATGPSGAAVSYASPATSDAVDGAGTASCTPASGTTFALGLNTVTCNASDAAGNVATSSTFKIGVVDTTAPVIAARGDILLVEASGPAGAAVSYASPATSDAVDGAGTASCAPASGSTFALGQNTVTCNARDAAGNAALSTTFTIGVVDTTGPAFASYPAVINATASGNAQAAVSFALPTATDLVDGPVAVTCDRASGSSFPAGSTTVTCSARDGRSPANVSTMSFRVQVDFSWTGFFRPVDNMPAINSVKAGSAIPVKFSLGGNQGLDIFKAGSPESGIVQCSGTSTGEITLDETVNAGGSSLTYDATAGQYVYVWKTDKQWSGCRILQLTLKDGSVQKALFLFKK